MTLCCVHGVWLPQLPGVYLWLPVLPGILQDSMLCTWSIWLPQLTGVYLWLPALSGIACLYAGYRWSMVTSVTWWLPVVTMCYQRYQVLHDSMQ